MLLKNVVAVTLPLCLLLNLHAVSSLAADSQRYRWELGLGLGAQILADYRGSSYYNAAALPFPYVKYDSRYLEVDRGKVRGKIYHTENWQLNISADTSLTVDADDNPLREGMPEIFPTFEFGPSLDFNLTGDDFDEGWVLRLPVRSVFAVDVDDQDIERVGSIFNPRFTFYKPEFIGQWSIKNNVGVIIGDKNYHEYYYSVASDYVSDVRPFYEAESGYSGLAFKSTVRKNFDDFWLSFSVRVDLLHKASFEDSPLAESDHYVALTMTSAYIFKRSR